MNTEAARRADQPTIEAVEQVYVAGQEKATTRGGPSQDGLSGSGVDEKDGGVFSAKVEGRPEREAAFKDYLRIFTYARRFDLCLMAGGIVASIGSGITMPLMNVVFGKLVGNFATFDSSNGDAFQSLVNRQSLIMFCLFLARFFLSYINKFCFRLIGIRMSAAIRLHYLKSLFAQTIHVLDSMPSGAAAGTITSTANTLQLGISEKLGTFIEFNATIVAAMVVAFTYSWSLTLVTASVILYIALVLSMLLPFIIKGVEKMTKAESTASSIATEAFAAIRMVTSCGAESRVAVKYAEWVNKGKLAGQSTSPLMASQFGLVFFGLYGGFSLSFWFGLKSFSEGRVDNAGTVVIVLMSVMLMVISLERTSTPLIAASKAMVAAAEFFTVIDAPQPRRGSLKEPDVSATADIIFKDVDFAYPSRPSKKVLDRLNLRIEANKNTAIVGPSGSGKSTVVGLLEGWYSLHHQYVIAKTTGTFEDKKRKWEKAKEERDKKRKKSKRDEKGEMGEDTMLDVEHVGPAVDLKGTIETCGHSIDEMDIKWWRAQIGLVQQEPFLFNDTIFSNVAAGLMGTQWEGASEEEKRELVKTACVESFADEFIDRLPDGYNTQVGESGTKLSGGQRQRIAIARSIVKRPKILILDEATSAIDVRGERVVQAALERASLGRTTITIAHRLSTIKKADRIVVLQNGRVAEEGTHDSLLADRNGAYYGLVHAQKLSLGEDSGADDTVSDMEEVVLTREKSAATSAAASGRHVAVWKDRNLFNGFFKLLSEQRDRLPLFCIALVGAMGAAASVPLQAYLFGHVIVVFAEPRSELQGDAEFWSKMWAFLAVGVGLSYFVTAAAATTVEHHVAAVYRQEYFECMLYQKTSFFDQEDNATGQLTARLAGDPNALKELLGINMVMLAVGLLSLVGALAISFAYGWKLALVALFVTVPMSLLSGYYRVRYEMQFNAMNEAVFVESSKFGAEAIAAFRTVSSLTMEESICGRYEALLWGHVVSAYRKSRWTTLVFAFSDSVSLACQALIFWYGGQLLQTGEYSPTAFFITYMAMINGAESAGQWLSFGPNAAQASAAASRILAARASRNRDTAQADVRVPDTEGGVRIELRNVRFKYPTRNVPVFRGIDLTVEKGQFAALVGASGAGKTSVVSLLERFYDVDGGQILFNGTNIADVNVYEYRRLLSLVAQEPTLFQGTVRENVLLGVDAAQVQDEALHQACRDANIHDFIVSLPDGYDTDIGSRGINLSGGQKQRLSIARALIRNPRVLLLDEATSSLDSENEKLVQAAFERVAQGRTTIAVAHRLATIQKADVIFVLGEGKVLEKGSHNDLLRRKGVYWNMCHNQALDR